jgi:hypothetical protein
VKYLLLLFMLGHSITAFSTSLFDHPAAANTEQLLTISSRLNRDFILRGRFTQTKRIAILQRPLISTGSLLRVKDRGILWQLKQPIALRYLITDQGIESLDSDNTIPSGGFSQSLGEIFSALVVGDTTTLANTFSLFFLADNNIQSATDWEIGLKPLADSVMARAIEYIVLSGDLQVKTIVIAEKNGDQTRLEFFDLSNTPATLSVEEANSFAH